MKKRIEDFRVVDNKTINKQHFLLILKAEDDLPEMFPGQFAEVLVEGNQHAFLRRPLSIHNADYKENTIEFLVQIVGEGTKSLSELKQGDSLNTIFPLGNHYSLPSNREKRALLVGGGCGVAPLLFLARYLKENQIQITTLIGGKRKRDILEKERYLEFGEVMVSTEDGSDGSRGFVTDHPLFLEGISDFSMIYTCGPEPMMKALVNIAKEKNLDCEVSLENAMACGIGACLCCVVETHKGNVCACSDGPVFNMNMLTW